MGLIHLKSIRWKILYKRKTSGDGLMRNDEKAILYKYCEVHPLWPLCSSLNITKMAKSRPGANPLLTTKIHIELDASWPFLIPDCPSNISRLSIEKPRQGFLSLKPINVRLMASYCNLAIVSLTRTSEKLKLKWHSLKTRKHWAISLEVNGWRRPVRDHFIQTKEGLKAWLLSSNASRQ
jgi:hypothetical protein